MTLDAFNEMSEKLLAHLEEESKIPSQKEAIQNTLRNDVKIKTNNAAEAYDKLQTIRYSNMDPEQKERVKEVLTKKHKQEVAKRKEAELRKSQIASLKEDIDENELKEILEEFDADLLETDFKAMEAIADAKFDREEAAVDKTLETKLNAIENNNTNKDMENAKNAIDRVKAQKEIDAQNGKNATDAAKEAREKIAEKREDTKNRIQMMKTAEQEQNQTKKDAANLNAEFIQEGIIARVKEWHANRKDSKIASEIDSLTLKLIALEKKLQDKEVKNKNGKYDAKISELNQKINEIQEKIAAAQNNREKYKERILDSEDRAQKKIDKRSGFNEEYDEISLAIGMLNRECSKLLEEIEADEKSALNEEKNQDPMIATILSEMAKCEESGDTIRLKSLKIKLDNFKSRM